MALKAPVEINMLEGEMDEEDIGPFEGGGEELNIEDGLIDDLNDNPDRLEDTDIEAVKA
mgnify:CR=1 FL=1